MANPSEKNISKDVESGLDIHLADSKSDNPTNSYASRVNNLLRTTRRSSGSRVHTSARMKSEDQPVAPFDGQVKASSDEVSSPLENIERKSKANPSEINFSKDEKSGLDMDLADSKGDNPTNRYATRVNNLLRTSLTKSEAQTPFVGKVNDSVQTEQDHPVTSFATGVNDSPILFPSQIKRVELIPKVQLINNFSPQVYHSLGTKGHETISSSSPEVNDLLGVERDETVSSSDPEVTGFLETKRDEPINFFASKVNDFSPSKRRVPDSSYALETERDEIVSSSSPKVTDFLGTKRDEPINFSTSEVNYALKTKRDETISSSNPKVTDFLGTKRDEPINFSASEVNDFSPSKRRVPDSSYVLKTKRDETISSSNPKVTDFLGTKRDEPINFSASEVKAFSPSKRRVPIHSLTAQSYFMRSKLGLLGTQARNKRISIREKENEDHIRESASTTKNDEDFISPMGNTLMHIATLGREDKWLMEIAQLKPHLLDKQNSNGDTPLHVAARFRYNRTLEKLLVALVGNLKPPYSEKPKEALDKILAKNKQGNTFFHEAVLNGEKDVMKILDYQELHIDQGFKELVELAALFWLNKDEKSIFHIAIEEGYEDTAVRALNRLSQHHALDELIKNHQELSQIIREAESPFTPQDQGRETKKEQVNSTAVENLDESQIVSKYMRYIDMRILMKSCSENVSPGNIEINKLSEKSQEQAQLIPRGHDYVPPAAKSPLIAAIFKHRGRDHDHGHGILHKILEKKKEWIDHLKDNEGRSVIHYAASMGYLDIVDRLLGMPNDWHMERDKDGYFPLHLASAGGHVKVIEKLLQNSEGIEDELVDNYGRNFIHIAAEMGKYNVIRFMLDRPNYPKIKEMVNFKDVNGNTPLHLATLRCHPKVVHALAWDERVDCSLANKRNETALDVCMQFQREFSSLRQRLIRVALESARSKKKVTRSQQPFKLPHRTQNAENGRKYRGQRKDLYKDRINTLMLVSTLITTVTFAAGFTLPGGTNSSDSEKGMALMLHHLWFKIFVFCITISMYGAISVTIILIWAQLGDINLTRLALRVTLPLLGITLTTLSVAFLAGVHLVISDLSWLATALLVLCVFFIIMLVALYILLYFFSSSGGRVFRYILNYPLKFLIWLDEQGQTHEARLVDSSSWYARVLTTIQGR